MNLISENNNSFINVTITQSSLNTFQENLITKTIHISKINLIYNANILKTLISINNIPLDTVNIIS